MADRFPFLCCLAAALVLSACGGASDGPVSASSTTTSTTSVGAAAPSAPDRSTGDVVTRVTDGDTFDVRIGEVVETVRIIGINAPESGECLADDATSWLRDRLEGAAVRLVVDESDRDQFGRLLRYVEIDGSDVGVELVEAGFAIARRYPPDTARHDALEAAQRSAESADIGMWADDACGSTSSASLVIDEIRFDAAGDDNEDLNDEWVRIANTGSAAVDMAGWVLKDESASHRFRFPSTFLLDAGASVTVRTGCGADTTIDLFWCNRGSAVWNNSGDTAFLLDPGGNIVDSRAG